MNTDSALDPQRGDRFSEPTLQIGKNLHLKQGKMPKNRILLTISAAALYVWEEMVLKGGGGESKYTIYIPLKSSSSIFSWCYT